MTPEIGSLEHWAANTPDAVAVTSDVATLRFGEWNEAANRLADSLEQLGLRAGDAVGVRSRLRTEWFIVNRALTKLGCAHVAINWRLTPGEAHHIAANSAIKACVFDDESADAMIAAWSDLRVGWMISMVRPHATDSELSLAELIAGGRDVQRFAPAAASVVLYTSGTTGRPKGVRDSDQLPADPALVERYVKSLISNPPVTDGAIGLLTLPMHHGAGPFSAGLIHQRGGAVHLLDPFDAEKALAMIERHRVTNWVAVPTMLLRIKALPPGVIEKYDLTSLRVVSVGAAAVPSALKAWALKALPPGVLWEGYGATEVGMVSYMTPTEQAERPTSSGRPYDGVEIRIVDSEWNDVETGSTGEVAVRTPRVLGRYIGEPPLGPDVLRDGFFKVGDIGHLDSDGYLYITDRMKDMIVAGGANIYPAEIEKALIEHGDVMEAAVIGIPHEEFGESPIAFVERRPGSTVTADELTAHLREHLAPYKRPREINFVDELPRSPMGKILKGPLREPYWRGRERNV